MKHYVDTAVIVAALTLEAGTAKAQTWIAAQPAGELLISDWVIAEFSSALSLKLRTGQIDTQLRTSASAAFSRFCSNKFSILAVAPGHFRAAASIAGQHTLGLRAGDALHLAIASDQGATICTFDRRIIDAGPVLAIPTVSP